MLHALFVSTGVVFAAELGDKSQLLALALATRYRFWPTVIGLTIATAIVHALSVGVGAAIGSSLDGDTIDVVAGLSFLGFALWTLRGDELDEAEVIRVPASNRAAILTVGGAFFVAELGDKTMFTTITLATREGVLGTWLGSTIGMVAADVLAIGVGVVLGSRLPERAVRYGAAALFAVFGGWMLYSGLS